MKLTDYGEIRALLARHGFHFSRSMGQNFLIDDAVPSAIADSAGLDDETGVLEIGPGIGCLTAELSERAKHVVSVELDRSLKPVLAETLADRGNVEIIFEDVLKLDLPSLVREKFAVCGRVCVCANLPYNVTTPVLTALVTAGCFSDVTVMIQREVALRVCAAENTADYGAFTVLMQWYAEPSLRFDVLPESFLPAPKVTSSVIRLHLREVPPVPVVDEKLMFSLVRAAFNQRRKTLYNALRNGLGGRFSAETIAAAIAACGFAPAVRGEALSVADFARLSDALSKSSADRKKTE